MTKQSRYINEGFPVYISYAWKNKDNPCIETDVDNLCKAMDAAGIFYKRDKDGLCPYRYSIQNAEEEIGQGCAIIMAISKKYIESIHCMNEWHFIRENGKIWERVFPIVLPCANITDEKVYNEYYEYFQKRKDTIIEKQRKGISDLTKVEASAAETGYFFEDLKKLQKFVADYNMGKNIIRDNNYSVVIDQLTAHLNSIMPHQEKKPQSTKKVSTTSEKHSAKWLWIVAVAIILAGLAYLIKPKTDDTKHPKLTVDANAEYVSNRTPKSGDTITVRFKNLDGYSLNKVKINGNIVRISGREHTFIIKNNVEISTEGCYEEDTSGWQTSNQWPYGRWKGGNSKAMPDGVGISVVYDQKVRLNKESAIDNPVGDKMAEPGDRVTDGCFHQGNFRYGTIIHSGGTTEIINP